MVAYKDYNIAKRDKTNDLRMPDKKKFYANRRFDCNAYERAVFELQEKIYSLAKHNSSAAQRIAAFTDSINRQLLIGKSGNNSVFSPISLFIALASLAVLSEGSSRQQIMDLIGYDSVDQLQEDIRVLIQPLSVSTDFYKNLVSSSIWLSDRVLVNTDKFQILADHFGAESFIGNIDDPEYTSAMRNWFNNATGQMLKETAHTIRFDRLSVMNVISTILFKALWDDEFNLSKTKLGTFYSPSGPVQVPFMYQDDEGTVQFGKAFTAVSRPLSYGNHMTFILPNEGYSPEELIENKEYQLLLDNRSDINNEHCIIHETIPKFDITTNYGVSSALKKLGVTDIFDEIRADFESAIKAADNVYISEIKHTCRLKIDEKGCEGAAVTIPMAVACCARPTEIYKFILDRPFITIVSTSTGYPLFMGIVNDPSQG